MENIIVDLEHGVSGFESLIKRLNKQTFDLTTERDQINSLIRRGKESGDLTAEAERLTRVIDKKKAQLASFKKDLIFLKRELEAARFEPQPKFVSRSEYDRRRRDFAADLRDDGALNHLIGQPCVVISAIKKVVSYGDINKLMIVCKKSLINDITTNNPGISVSDAKKEARARVKSFFASVFSTGGYNVCLVWSGHDGKFVLPNDVLGVSTTESSKGFEHYLIGTLKHQIEIKNLKKLPASDRRKVLEGDIEVATTVSRIKAQKGLYVNVEVLNKINAELMPIIDLWDLNLINRYVSQIRPYSVGAGGDRSGYKDLE